MDNGFVYLFFGFNGEYVLSPLYIEMARRGYECLEIDTSLHTDVKSRLEALKGRKTILVTCAHVFMDNANMDAFYPGYPEAPSVLEVMDYLKPVRSIYYPHDLMDGFTHFDRYWFSLFDVYLSPLPVNGHGRRFCSVEEVGWIKKEHAAPSLNNCGSDIRIGHGLGYFEYYKEDLERMYETFRPLWDLGVKVKLPMDRLNRDKYERFFALRNVELYPDDCSIFDMIDISDIVLTNAVTGVTVEAALSGRRVINIYDPGAGFRKNDQLAKITGLPHTSIKTVIEAVSAIEDIMGGGGPAGVGKDVMKPFDMEKAIEIIVGKSPYA